MAIVEGIFTPSVHVTTARPILDQIRDYRTRPNVLRQIVETGATIPLHIIEKKGLINEKSIEVAADGRATIETLIIDKNKLDDDASLGGFVKMVIGKRIPDEVEVVFIASPEDRREIVSVYYYQPNETPHSNK